MSNITRIECTVSALYPAEDFERLVNANAADRRRAACEKKERRLRRLEIGVNAVLTGCIALVLAAVLGLV